MTDVGGYLLVGLAGASRAIALGAVHEVVRAPTISRVPAGPPWVRGLTAVRGRLVPVVDLAAAPGAGPRPGPTAASGALLVIVGVAGRALALMVDGIDGVVDGSVDLATLPPPIDLDRLHGAA